VPRVYSPGEVLPGGYHIEGQLGRGGHSIIYAARDVSDGKPVAVKVLDDDGLTEAARARFVREADIHRKLQSEHVARVLAAYDLERTGLGRDGTGGRLVYIVMERLTGEDAERRVQREGPQPVERAIGWILDACDALAEAHAAGVVHRDLKPANLFLVRGPDRPSMVKLLDFGIARLRDGQGITGGRLTTSTSVFGSPAYIAPEQLLSSHKADARADVYGLGATLFELVTGQVPFPAKNLADMTANIIREPPRSPRAIRPDIPTKLDRIILRCLAKNPAERFQTVIELRDALLDVLVDPKEAPKTVFESKPPAAALAHARKDRHERTRSKEKRRQRVEIALTAFAAMMLVILAGATIFLIWGR
jgi:eukaryotic-like serine/threonine-protein kinase